MANPLKINTSIDLAAYEDNDDLSLDSDPTASINSKLKSQKRNQKRNDWAKGINRSQPSENWDDDFFFGSASAQSLPLATPNDPPLKPGSSSPLIKPGSSSPLTSFNHHQPNSLNATPAASSHFHSNSTTPRNPRQFKQPAILPHSISPASTLPLASSSSRSRPPLFRPPASAPPSRGQSSDPISAHHPLDNRRVSSINNHNHPLRSATIPLRPPSPHRPPPTLSLPRRPSASHKAVSSQDSVPSISDLSSTGFRSPSSSLSMTDDSRGDWSRSSGDYSARFGGTGSGNLSFNTETEFTEPDTELDWGDDTDLENRSAQSIVYKPRPSRHLHSPLLVQQHHAQKLPPQLGPYSPPISLSSLQQTHPAALHFSSSLIPPAASDVELVSTSPSLAVSKSSDQQRRLAHSSFDSQSTFTSAHSAKSRKPVINHSAPCASATSSTSSIGYYKSNHSDISLGPSTSKTHLPNQFAGYSIYPSQDALVRRNHTRVPSLSPGCPGSYQSGSESYDAATSGTETDGASDQILTDCSARNPSGIQSSSATPIRITSAVSQRSRKQALYTRPAYVNPASSSVSSLAVSVSSTTLNTSTILNTSLRPTAAASGDASQSELSLVGDEDKANKNNNLRKKLRKKRPSVLPLNKPIEGAKWSNGLARKPSLSESIYTPASAEMGDLAFAADSEDEERHIRARSRTVANGSTSPFEIVDKHAIPSLPGSHSPPPPRSASILHRALSTKSRSNISRSSHSGPATAASGTTTTSCLGTYKQGSSNNSNNKADSSHHQQVEDGMMKKFKPRRPLSFTALLSRNSMSSNSQAHSNNNNVGNHGQLEAPNKLRTRTSHRYSASIGSHTHHPVLATSPHPSTATETFFSRVRRLSSRPQSAKQPSPPSSPTRKRFSIIGGANNRFSSLNGTAIPPPIPPTTPTMAEPASAPVSASKTQTRKGVSHSDSIASDLTLSGTRGAGYDDKNTVRGGRPSSRASSVTNSGGFNSQQNLTRKFSARNNNKGAVHEAKLTHTLTDSVDHDLCLSSSTAAPPPGSSSSSSRLSVARRSVASKPPKSNPALRAKAEACAATRDHCMEGYLRSPHSFTLSPADMSPADGTFPGQYVTNHAGRAQSGPPTGTGTGHDEQRVASSEAVLLADREDGMFSDSELHHAHHPTLQQAAVMTSGSGSGPLARSNSMGELRIPSRITSQQDRLQNELNQVKEFARGIEDLKSMRRAYRKMMRNSMQHDQSKEGTPQQVDSGTEESDSTDSDTRQSSSSPRPGSSSLAAHASPTSKPGEVSPKALRKLCSSIAKIEEAYREWWTCCNVLIDLGEGSKDPRSKFSPERVAAITAYNNEKAKAEAGGAKEKRHFEILKSMFGPRVDGQPVSDWGLGEDDDDGSGSGWRTPPQGKNASVESLDRTPVSRAPGAATMVMVDPATPTAAGGGRGERERSRALRLSDWNDSDCGSAISITGSVTGKNGGAECLEGANVSGGGKKGGKKSARHSSYQPQQQQQTSASAGKFGNRGGGGAGRIGINGIKDFLRVLKARVHLEEKWPSKLLVVASTVPTEVLKRRAVSTPLQEALRPRGGGGSGSKGKDKSGGGGEQGKDGHAEGQADEQGNLDEGEGEEDETRSSSSSEEFWDDLFLKDPTSAVVVGQSSSSGVADGLDLAVARKENISGEARLALSSESMPQILRYMRAVRVMCQECLGELKAQTV